MRYVLLIGSWLLFLLACQNDTATTSESLTTEKWTKQDSLIQQSDSLFDVYYDYQLDSIQMMVILTQFEDLSQNDVDQWPRLYAHCQHLRAKVLYAESNYEQAINYYKKALNLWKNLPEGTPAKLAGLNNGISLCHDLLYQYDLALQYSHFAVREPEELPSDLKARIYHQLARTYSRIQDLDNARLYLENAIAMYAQEKEKHKGDGKRKWEVSWGMACQDMASLLCNDLEDPQSAYPYLANSLDVFGSLKKRSDSVHLANTHHTEGIYYELLDSLDLALESYERSLALNRSLSGRSRFIGSNLDNMGIIHKKMGHWPLAKRCIREASRRFVELGERVRLSMAYDNLGDVWLEEGKIDSANAYYNRAMRYLVATYQANSPDQNPMIRAETISDKNGLFITLSSKATALHQRYQKSGDSQWMSQAFDAYLKLDSLADLMRLEFHSDLSKASLVARTKPMYEKAIALSLKLWALTQDDAYGVEAFRFAEKSKSIILLEAIRNSKAQLVVDEELLQKEKHLNIRKNYYEKKYAMALPSGKKQAKQWLDSLTTYRIRHYGLVDQITKEKPAFRVIKQNSQPVPLSLVQNTLLLDGQCFIEYFVGQQNIYAFVISQNDLHIQTIPLDHDLITAVKKLTDGISQRNVRSYYQPAHYLYQRLIAPLEAWVGKAQHLVLAPDGILAHIPFEALLLEEPTRDKAMQLKDYPYLMKRYLISYNYTATLWQEMRQDKEVASRKLFVGFAPAFKKAQPAVTRSPRDSTYFFNALRWNEEEVKTIRKRLGGETFTGASATIEELKKQAPLSQILHLATHGRADDVVGDFSHLLFSGQQRGQYDHLFTKDLYAMQLNSAMVVLSACDTNTGELKEGEGIISLARGFSYAGAASIITTLWEIEDEASKDLMIYFYEELIAKNTKSEALRNAKWRYIRQQKRQRKAHPFFWASFISIGNMQALSNVEKEIR